MLGRIQDQNTQSEELHTLEVPVRMKLACEHHLVILPIPEGKALNDALDLLRLLRESQLLEYASESHVNHDVLKVEQVKELVIDLLRQLLVPPQILADHILI